MSPIPESAARQRSGPILSDPESILMWLHETDEEKLSFLWQWADTVRREHVGDAVYFRGLVEISNHCARLCSYCGINAEQRRIQRYRMTHAEILDCVKQIGANEIGTVVLQAGEDPGITTEWMSELIRAIKGEQDIAVTLSLGERDIEELKAWRAAGADRYLLRFETSDTGLYNQIHPPKKQGAMSRIACLREIKALGYETGSGIMVGIPGQSVASIRDDILLFSELELDMIGIGPYLPHPETPLGKAGLPCSADQAPSSSLMASKAVALARLICPNVNIPSTTALATIDKAKGREMGLLRGANVLMPNFTPIKYRRLYEIYPAKSCLVETPDYYTRELVKLILSLGRVIGKGPGGISMLEKPQKTK